MYNYKTLINLPNILSISRIFFAIPLFLMLKNFDNLQNPLIIILVIVIIATDYLDGFFSRKFDQKTFIGQILDPVSDKISMAIVALGLILYHNFPLKIIIFLLYRDILIFVYVFFLVEKKTQIRANIWGKINTTIFSFVFISFVFWGNFKIFNYFIYSAYVSLILSSLINLLEAEKYLKISNKIFIIFVRIVLLFSTLCLIYLVMSFVPDYLNRD